ncbi:MAG: hypothetical protein ACYTGK_01905 [Planctomycetota bacterium]|jgi:hypothetical protein
MRTVAALLTLVVVALGQECPSGPCAPAAEKAAPDLSAKIAQLEESAEKGCEKSEAKLTELCKAAGAADTKDLKAKVKAFEQYAPCGCDMSKKKLAELTAVLAPQPSKAVVSARLPILLAVVRNGDAQAKTILKQLCDQCCPPDCGDDRECGKDCGDKLVVMVQTLEASAAKGCATSATKLAKAETMLASLPSTSTRVAKVLAGARKDDPQTQALMMSLCEECCPQDCGKGECGGKGGCAGKGERTKDCGKDCDDKLIARIQKLEASMAKGCATSPTKLARVETKLGTVAKAKKPADCGSGGGCLPEGCPGG